MFCARLWRGPEPARFPRASRGGRRCLTSARPSSKRRVSNSGISVGYSMAKGTTRSATKAEALKGRKWWLVDANEKTVGRLATRIASVLKGKHKPSYTPSMDVGDFVVVVNAGKARFTGKKETDKVFFSHTMYPGGAKQTPMDKIRARHPEDIVLNAVRRMLPRSNLGRQMLTKLKVYAGDKHPHAAQKPEQLPLAQ